VRFKRIGDNEPRRGRRKLLGNKAWRRVGISRRWRGGHGVHGWRPNTGRAPLPLPPSPSLPSKIPGTTRGEVVAMAAEDGRDCAHDDRGRGDTDSGERDPVHTAVEDRAR
jgi:hypothetical protein